MHDIGWDRDHVALAQQPRWLSFFLIVTGAVRYQQNLAPGRECQNVLAEGSETTSCTWVSNTPSASVCSILTQVVLVK